MKIKDIVMREDDGTGALTTKPLPGAQQIIAPDGKPIGTADQATADAMKAAAEKGTLTLGGDEQQTSEEQEVSHHTDLHIARKLFHTNPDLDDEQEILNAAFPFVVELMNGSKKRANHLLNYNQDFPAELIGAYKWLQRHQHSVHESHNDLVDQGNGDVGGDGTDQFIHDIKMNDSTVDQSSVDVMRSAITSALTNSELSPEQKEAAQTLIVKDADGDVDADKTLIACVKSIPAAMDELVNMFSKIVEVGEAYISGSHSYEPTFATLSPEDQAKYKQDIADLKGQLSNTSLQLQQQKPDMDKSIGDLQNTLSQATPQKPASESKRADDELLEKMRMIAGLR